MNHKNLFIFSSKSVSLVLIALQKGIAMEK